MPLLVISGLMSGIGFIIIILQFAPFLGQANPSGGPLAALLNIPALLAHPMGDAVAVGVVSLAVVFLTPAPIGRFVSAPLISPAVGTVLALYLFTGAPVLADVPTGLPALQVPTLTVKDIPDIVGAAPVLAGILFKDGIDVIDWDYFRRIRRAPQVGVFFMLVVLGLTVFVDLIVAVAVGVVMASLLFVKRMADLQEANIRTITGETEDAPLSEEAREILKSADGRLLLFHLDGPMSFRVAKGMGRRFSVADKFEARVLDLTDVPLIDSSASLALRDGIKHARAEGRSVFMAGAPGGGRGSGPAGRVRPIGRRPPVRETRAKALRAALDHIGPSLRVRSRRCLKRESN